MGGAVGSGPAADFLGGEVGRVLLRRRPQTMNVSFVCVSVGAHRTAVVVFRPVVAVFLPCRRGREVWDARKLDNKECTHDS